MKKMTGLKSIIKIRMKMLQYDISKIFMIILKISILNYLNLKISYENSMSIINNHMDIDMNLKCNKEAYEKMILKRFNNNLNLQDIFSFDNDKK